MNEYRDTDGRIWTYSKHLGAKEADEIRTLIAELNRKKEDFLKLERIMLKFWAVCYGFTPRNV